MKSLKKFGLLLTLAALMVFAAACGGASTDKNEGTDNKDSKTAELSGTLSVSGSSAMQPLVAAAAEEFMAENPNVDIQVNAGGS
ncbi:phosphate-binding protein, partial [Neobacillus drentensis]